VGSNCKNGVNGAIITLSNKVNFANASQKTFYGGTGSAKNQAVLCLPGKVS
jgi:hypothetical protein